VWPILKRLKIPATLFLATQYIETQRPFPFDGWGVEHEHKVPAEAWRPLSWAQCREMQASGLLELGTHSHTHRSFRDKPAELERDLLTSLSVLEDQIGPGPRPFAYPFGSGRKGFAEAPIQDAARRAGVTCALTTEIGSVDPRTDPFSWPRLEVADSDKAATVKAKLEGWYTWMTFCRDVFRYVRHVLPT
jgi:peptidoglycan/xylan/chitin deacetylase (PgdA/CDA1 family)